MFELGTKSKNNLIGVHPIIRGVVLQAITLTTQDFGVYEGLRTIERQREYMKRGVTRTMNSKHLKQSDGLGHAVDLVPYIDGSYRWEWKPIYAIAVAVDRAATEQGVADRIRWGGVWDRNMGQYGTNAPSSMEQAVAEYVKRHPGPDFIDGPHFELRS